MMQVTDPTVRQLPERHHPPVSDLPWLAGVVLLTLTLYASAFVDRGNAYMHKGAYDRAIEDYDQAIRLKPDFAFAFADRGKTYFLKGDRDRALQDSIRRSRLCSGNPQQGTRRGACRLQRVFETASQ